MAPATSAKQGKQQNTGPRRPSKPLKGASGKKTTKAPAPVQQKTKSAKSLDQRKKKRRVYSEEELNLPKLNMITPAGVQKPRGKKKGKVFVDDPHTMQTIFALVNAETEGKIESKMLKARQMEEIREARQREMEAKEEQRKQALESKKNELRKSRKKAETVLIEPDPSVVKNGSTKKPKKRVSFG